MPRHSLASPKTVRQKTPRSRQGRSLPGLPFGSFMATALCGCTALVRLWEQLSSRAFRRKLRSRQSIDMPPASESRGSISIDCFFLFQSLIGNFSTMRLSNLREDGRKFSRDRPKWGRQKKGAVRFGAFLAQHTIAKPSLDQRNPAWPSLARQRRSRWGLNA
jgi:hypothetical protein